MEAQRLGNLPKITQLKWKHREVRQLVKNYVARGGSTESSGNLPKITQPRIGSTERSGNFPMNTQLRSGSKEKMVNLPNITELNWKHRDLRLLA